MYNKDKYESRKLNHECWECGTKDARTMAGKTLCQSCADRKIAAQVYRNAVRKKKHLCYDCGKQDAFTLAGDTRYAVCAEKNRIRFMRWKARCS